MLSRYGVTTVGYNFQANLRLSRGREAAILQRFVLVLALLLVTAPFTVHTAKASIPQLPLDPVEYRRNNSTIDLMDEDPGYTIRLNEYCVKQNTLCVGPAGPFGPRLSGPYGAIVNVTWLNVTLRQEKSDMAEYGPYRLDVLGSPVYVCYGGCVVQSNFEARVNSSGWYQTADGERSDRERYEFDYNTSNATRVRYRFWDEPTTSGP